jgi:tRNA1Val (adenine37-N6)-methyltransferase
MPSPSPASESPDWAQPPRGYRFSEDSVLLAGFAPGSLRGPDADLGAGCGVVGLEALAKGRLKGSTALFLVERDEGFLPYLQGNAALALASLPSPPRIIPLIRDWRELGLGDLGGPLAAILANPPYLPRGRGRFAKGDGAFAKGELFGGLGSLLAASRGLLAPGGTLTLSLPARRLGELASLARPEGLALGPLRFHGRGGSQLLLARLSSPPAQGAKGPA